MKLHDYCQLAFIAFLTLLLLIAPNVLAAQPMYSVTALPPLGGCCNSAQGINNSGQVVGWSRVAGGIDHPFLYTNGQMQDLGIIGEGYAINNAGQVTGGMSIGPPTGEGHCFLYSNNQIYDLGTLGGPHCTGYGINDIGQVTGTSWVDYSSRRAFLYSNGQMQDLGTLGGNESFGQGINKNGQVVGGATIPGDQGFGHAFLYSNGQMQDLGTLGGQHSGAQAINNAGQVVGVAQILAAVNHAFLYSDGQMQDLGTLGGTSSGAQAINNAGQIVGFASTPADATHAFLYTNGQMQDLNDLIDPTLGWTLIYANGINDTGQIVGYGYYQGQQWGFLLTPVATLFAFTGFFPPISNPPVLNEVKAGQAIPVKFSLHGDQGLNIFATGYPKSQEVLCDTDAPLNDVQSTNTAGGSSLTYDPSTDQYTYTWKTDKSWGGTCRQLIVQLNDGTAHVANFHFK